jgi:DNA-binding CsgD family transcriptional regulator
MQFPDVEHLLTDRQRIICLLTSIGEYDKQIADLLDIGLRTVEHERRYVATLLERRTRYALIWAIENRRNLYQGIRDWASVPAHVRQLVDGAIQ